MKKIDEYFKTKAEKKLVQANIEKTIIKKIDSYRKSKKLSWSDLIGALFKRLLDEEIVETKKGA